MIEEQKVKNPINVITAFNQVLGNPAKKYYKLVVTRGERNKEDKVKAIVAKGGTASSNYNNAHIEGLNLLGKIIFLTKLIRRSAHGCI